MNRLGCLFERICTGGFHSFLPLIFQYRSGFPNLATDPEYAHLPMMNRKSAAKALPRRAFSRNENVIDERTELEDTQYARKWKIVQNCSQVSYGSILILPWINIMLDP